LGLFEQIGLCTIGYLKPTYKVGDILWVRETWADTKDSPGNIHYKASATEADLEWLKDCGVKWKPSIHIPRDAARIFLKVTNVRAERLQDISEDDAKAEGAKVQGANPYDLPYTHQKGFRRLWDELYAPIGDSGWDANPWVWVISFERVNHAAN
jgi:hypothetical protein